MTVVLFVYQIYDLCLLMRDRVIYTAKSFAVFRSDWPWPPTSRSFQPSPLTRMATHLMPQVIGFADSLD